MSEKQEFNLRTPNGETIYTEPGKKGPGDMKIYTIFPKMPWAHSLYYIGICLRLKGMVEERMYPPPASGKGKLMTFCHDCIFKRDMSIEEICRKHQIPLRDER